MLKWVKSGFYNLIFLCLFLHFTVAKSFHSFHCLLFPLILISVSNGIRMELLIPHDPWGRSILLLSRKYLEISANFCRGRQKPLPLFKSKILLISKLFFPSMSLDLEDSSRGDFPSNKNDFRFKRLRFTYISFIQLNFHSHLRLVIITEIRRKEN